MGVIDVAGLTLGRMARRRSPSCAAKHKTDYTPTSTAATSWSCSMPRRFT